MSGRIAAALDDPVRAIRRRRRSRADPARTRRVHASRHALQDHAGRATARSATREERERALQFAARLSLPVIDRAWQVLGKGLDEVRAVAARRSPPPTWCWCALPTSPICRRPTRRCGGWVRPGGPRDAATGGGRDAQAGSRPRLSARGGGASTPGGARSRDACPEAGSPVSSPASAPTRSQPQAVSQAVAQAVPQAVSKPAPQPVAPPMFRTFDEVRRAGGQRTGCPAQGHARARRAARALRGRHALEFSLAPGGSPDLAQRLMRKLQDWTGRRWMVALSSAPGEPSVREKAEAKRRERERGVAQMPLVRRVLEQFPSAPQIVAVRDLPNWRGRATAGRAIASRGGGRTASDDIRLRR